MIIPGREGGTKGFELPAREGEGIDATTAVWQGVAGTRLLDPDRPPQE